MKTLALLLFSCLTLTGTAYAQQSVSVYTDDFSGSHVDLNIGKYPYTTLLRQGITSVAGFKIPAGLRVTLFQQQEFTGPSLVLTTDTDSKFLKAKGFAQTASSFSIIIDRAPVSTPKGPHVTIYKDNFSGAHQDLEPGKYEPADLTIGNDQLTSLKIPAGMKVIVYEHEAFAGRSLTLTKDTGADFMTKNKFNDQASSIIVELLPEEPKVTVVEKKETVILEQPVVVKEPALDAGPTVTIYEGSFAGTSKKLSLGEYDLAALGIEDNELSSLQVPKGLRVKLFEQPGFKGRVLEITNDAPSSFLNEKNFNNITSSIIVELATATSLQESNTGPAKAPAAIVYKEDFSGPFASLTPGKYDFRDAVFEDNAVSTVRVPRGLKVTLFENGSFKGRWIALRSDASFETLSMNDFDDITTSVIVEEIPREELVVTVYDDTFTGRKQMLMPGRYITADLINGNDKITSVRVPKGMRAILYEDDYFTGRSVTLEDSRDLSQSFNDRTSSIVVEDIYEVETSTPPAKEIVPEQVQPTPEVVEVPAVLACEMTAGQYETALKAVKAKPFRDERMSTARLSTKDKCMNLEQIRGMAALFSFEDQALEFVKYAYELSTEKSEYYTLSDIFKFMSSREDFTKFLEGK